MTAGWRVPRVVTGAAVGASPAFVPDGVKRSWLGINLWLFMCECHWAEVRCLSGTPEDRSTPAPVNWCWDERDGDMCRWWPLDREGD